MLINKESLQGLGIEQLKELAYCMGINCPLRREQLIDSISEKQNTLIVAWQGKEAKENEAQYSRIVARDSNTVIFPIETEVII